MRKLVNAEAKNYAINVYPNDQHSINLEHSRQHLYYFLTEQIKEKLGVDGLTQRERNRIKRLADANEL